MAVEYVGRGAQSTGAGGNRGPSLPAGMAEDDFMVCSATARTNAGSYSHPTTGWTAEGPYRSGNKNTLQLFWKLHDGSESVSALKYTQGEDGADESQAAQYAAFRGVDLSNPLIIGTPYSETGVQNISFANGVTVPNGGAVLYIGHKSDDWTEVATFSGDSSLTWVEIGEPDTTTGHDAGMVWGYALNDTGSAVTLGGTGSAVVTGGAVANALALFVVLNPEGAASAVVGSGASTLALISAGDGSVSIEGSGASVLTLTSAGVGAHEVVGSGSAVLSIAGTGAGVFILGVAGFGASVLVLLADGTGSAPVQEDEPPPLTVVAAQPLGDTLISTGELHFGLTGAGAFDFYVTWAGEPLLLSNGDYLATEH